MTAETALADQFPQPPNHAQALCSRCQLPLKGQLVRALQGVFHLDCFTCLDCGKVVASKFFPTTVESGKILPLCERDYFRRLNLVCENCGEALRGAYISALDKKYHVEHFTCSMCSIVFSPEDSYYEHEGKVYCHYHYSVNYAVKCSGCKVAILKQFVEINRNSVDEFWHPECYMINKYWNVKISQPFLDDDDNRISQEPNPQDTNDLLDIQQTTEQKVYQIWTVLSAFEESSAACISDMLMHVSNGAYMDSAKLSERFIVQVGILFDCIDSIEARYIEFGDETLRYKREAKMLCKKIVNFFSLLSHSQDMARQPQTGVGEELLSSVTGLAHYLKVLIRVTLTSALRLENQWNCKTATSDFLEQLMRLSSQDAKHMMNIPDSELTSDLCQTCKITLEEPCIRYARFRWHLRCFHCRQCKRSLKDDYNAALFHPPSVSVVCFQCANHGAEKLIQGFEYVTRLQQYSFLLSVALGRLYSLLKLPEAPSPSPSSRKDKTDGKKSKLRNPLRGDARVQSYTGDEKLFKPAKLTDIKRMKSTHMDRKLSQSHKATRKSVIVESRNLFAPTAPLPIPKIPSGTSSTTSLKELPPLPVSNDEQEEIPETQTLADMHSLGNEAAITLDDIPHIAARTGDYQRGIFFSDLSALQHLIVRHIAVVKIEPHVKDVFTMEELLDMIESKKASLWDKFMTSFKQGNKNRVKEMGTFGVPFEALVERNGADSIIGAGPSPVRIPTFIEDSILAMRQMDMSVEGVFRKNGNIRRLKELSEIIDRDPSEAMLADENPIQVAALLKKFLREMPEPLLTFKLHRLIIFSQKLESEAERRRVLHLALCMMPKVNRDTVEVLLHFLRWTATFAHVDGKMGSMMDLTNLATVIAPNVLYSKSKDPAKDESFMAISAFEMMLKYEDSFCFVPDDIAQLLHDPMLLEDTANMTSKDFMPKLEAIMKGRKQQETNEFAADANSNQHDPYHRPPPEYPLYPRQHRYEPEQPAGQLGLLSPLPYRSHSLSRQRDAVPHSQSPSSLRTQVNLPSLVNDNRLSHPSPSATTPGGLRS
ncbi:hypothetical protein K450DRAFT_232442 [Umbelopsis ramanniana AG]|uniref:RhoGAP-domain-containing protein n=1 Tax=Umbelopsis ramanniana AG TaxID=1314678 RepID=A0AAD5HEG9_UMBRA|nr:uncharacterized protein K450DRAFT_232442 [Umbelopsis ramanniana AG]KAI8581312.1 hypothetical protein K450DRAFT_232442 [Umbelopsis ramanniana AG]